MQCVGSVGIIAVIGEVGDLCASCIPCKEEEHMLSAGRLLRLRGTGMSVVRMQYLCRAVMPCAFIW